MMWCYLRNRQQGAATLLLTALMISLMLIVVGRAAQLSRYQLTELQYETERRQSFWQAEGELECLWTQIRSVHAESALPSACQQIAHQIRSVSPREQQLTATVGTTTLQKRYRLPLPDSAATVKSSSRLILMKPASFAPDLARLHAAGDWQCIAVRYKYDFYAPSLTTYHPDQLPYPLYAGFPNDSGRCHESYHSVALSAEHARSDYQHTPTLSPFRDLFGVAVQQWFQVMSNPQVGRIPASLNEASGQIRYQNALELPHSQLNPECAAQIENLIRQGKMIIWVYGGCVLSDLDVQRINTAIQAKFSQQGIIVLIQDGLVGIESHHPLQGMLYQFISPRHANIEFQNWRETELQTALIQSLAQQRPQRNISPEQVSYFQLGSFYPAGGLVLDADRRFAVVQGHVDFHYRRDLLIKPLSLIRPAKWRGESWYEP
ncbi:hypothetical protein VR7878_00335 [Vibrio ruber DSM 16370]|uniref:Uncharacterized protein n=1 Tax=Vibrio ruber (strain DSM 16370 / JCM 11486 / BCRC 17186 / CECT 7878 / LMG 23124 / VR1) TaxID=1123498 RepID=A0A1R4LAN4_VIBR1|nr:hypothetical protein [Vibrio ruber]SJN53453.1 hypothetical protein VR7878_00335 [Vibrio ruber DSM 16370]